MFLFLLILRCARVVWVCVCVTLGIIGILSDCFSFTVVFLVQQGATGAPEERWPTKTSSGARVNVPAKLVTCLFSLWFAFMVVHVVLLLIATRVSCFESCWAYLRILILW